LEEEPIDRLQRAGPIGEHLFLDGSVSPYLLHSPHGPKARTLLSALFERNIRFVSVDSRRLLHGGIDESGLAMRDRVLIIPLSIESDLLDRYTVLPIGCLLLDLLECLHLRNGSYGPFSVDPRTIQESCLIMRQELVSLALEGEVVFSGTL
jgi:hypothetical protein